MMGSEGTGGYQKTVRFRASHFDNLGRRRGVYGVGRGWAIADGGGRQTAAADGHVTMDDMSDRPQSSRRDFLRGRAVVDVLAQAVAGAVDAGEGGENANLENNSATSHSCGPGHVTSLRRRAMACDFEVQLADGRQEGALAAVLEAFDLVESLETQMTVYRATSEVLEINRAAADGPVAVEPRLFAMFELAERLNRETDGAFDITSGPLSEAWGFSRREGRVPSEAEIAEALGRVGMQDVVLDAAQGTIAFRRRGLSLHLNSIGKGYALDRMAEVLAGQGVENFLLHGGRSSVLARGGSSGNTAPGNADPNWVIGLPHPLRPGERVIEIPLADRALGTSGSGTQFFEHGGRRYGHLLDPRTGWPAEGVYTATAIAPTAAEADALSTAFYVMGPEQTGLYCATRPEIGAVLVCPAPDSNGAAAGDVEVWPFGISTPR
jgi:FAD:protein FMN transferase